MSDGVEEAIDGSQEDLPQRFSLVAGGAFHSLLGRLGLLEDDMLPSRRAAILLALVAFSIPATFAALQTLLDAQYNGWDYFQDVTVYTRYLIAILIMISTESLADSRIVLMTQYLSNAGLLSTGGRARFTVVVRQADRRASSYRAELLILLIAFCWSMMTTRYTADISVDGWEAMTLVGGGVGLSWAGEVSAFTSNTLFLFLVLRWFWRFYIWAALLWRTASLKLQIMPLHPDRCGGLGILAIFPGIFSGLVFALSCVVAAAFHKVVPLMQHPGQAIWMALALWSLMIMLIFLGPLVAFVRPLYEARETAQLEYGRLAHEHHLAFHARWLEAGANGEDLLGSVDPSSVSDLNASVQTVNEMSAFPVDRRAVIQLLASAVSPFLVVAALQMPVGELLKLILGVLL
jgi:hypothetical protein